MRPWPRVGSVSRMNLNDAQTYEMTIQTRAEERLGYRLTRGGERVKFSAPASTRGIAKLYVVSYEQKLLYVGIAEQPMSSRLIYGLNAVGEKGYHGYKWKHLREQLNLTIWTASSNGSYVQRRGMETIEAEVAFVWRRETGQWPEYQHEIHFFASNQDHKDSAVSIYHHVAGIQG